MKSVATLLSLLAFVALPVNAGEGFNAGYRWAMQKGVDDPDYCYSRSGGYINNSPSFTEGCLQYLRDEAIVDEDDELLEDDSEEEPQE